MSDAPKISNPWPARLAIVAVLAAMLGAFWWLLRPRATLDGLDALVAVKRFDDAQELVSAYLDENPDDQRARLRLARLAIDRPDPQFAIALEQFEAVTDPDPKLAAEWKGVEGSALYGLGRFSAAEAAWLDALKIDKAVPEAGWALLNLYALQGRDDDARALGLDLFRVEPDPHDRIQILLQLIRHDAHAISAEAIIGQLEPVCRAHPGDVPSAVALAQGYLRGGRTADAQKLLDPIIASNSATLESWLAYLDGLTAAGDAAKVESAIKRIPPSFQASPRLDAARGWLAAQKRDFAGSADLYLRSWKDRPFDPSLAYRLLNALRLAGRQEDLKALGPKLQVVNSSRDRIREFYDEIDALPGLGRTNYADRFDRVAAFLDEIDRKPEAAAWREAAKAAPTRKRSF